MKQVPPLLQLIEGRRVRPRKASPQAPREIVLHMQVAALLRKHARPDWRWAHFPAGEARTARTAAKLKAMGVPRGWPDFILLDPAGRWHGLELKRKGAGLSEGQEEFQIWSIRSGTPYSVCSTMPEVLAVFRFWECLDLPDTLAEASS